MPIVRGCRNRRCPEYATGPDGWCDAHRRPRYERRPVYDPGWPARRAAQLAAFPFCAECGALATEAHHVTRDPETLLSLCHDCHATVTGREGGQSWP